MTFSDVLCKAFVGMWVKRGDEYLGQITHIQILQCDYPDDNLGYVERQVIITMGDKSIEVDFDGTTWEGANLFCERGLTFHTTSQKTGITKVDVRGIDWDIDYYNPNLKDYMTVELEGVWDVDLNKSEFEEALVNKISEMGGHPIWEFDSYDIID